MINIPESDFTPSCQKAGGEGTAECFVPGCVYWEMLISHIVDGEERLVRVTHLGSCARKHTDNAA